MIDHLTAGLLHALHCARENPMLFDPPLDSPEYAARIAKLNSAPSLPPREDWPIDHRALAEHADARVTMSLQAAARHAREARMHREADINRSDRPGWMDK